MLFIASLRGFNIPEKWLYKLNTENAFCVITKNNYFYSSVSWETDKLEEIPSIINTSLELAEKYNDTFKNIIQEGGDIELYITHRSTKTEGFNISNAILTRIAQLGVSVGID